MQVVYGDGLQQPRVSILLEWHDLSADWVMTKAMEVGAFETETMYHDDGSITDTSEWAYVCHYTNPTQVFKVEYHALALMMEVWLRISNDDRSTSKVKREQRKWSDLTARIEGRPTSRQRAKARAIAAGKKTPRQRKRGNRRRD